MNRQTLALPTVLEGSLQKRIIKVAKLLSSKDLFNYIQNTVTSFAKCIMFMHDKQLFLETFVSLFSYCMRKSLLNYKIPSLRMNSSNSLEVLTCT